MIDKPDDPLWSELRRVDRFGSNGSVLDNARIAFGDFVQNCLRKARRGQDPLKSIHYGIVTHALARLLHEERADAERVQRELAGAARHETERMRQAWMVQRERADGLERALLNVAAVLHGDGGHWRKGGETPEQIQEACIAQWSAVMVKADKTEYEATRPYRMAIARWRTARHSTDKAVVAGAINDMLNLLTDSDLDAARQDGK